jgi:pSer/pThr/pTyr-binding forkhead associated (FHA) protein
LRQEPLDVKQAAKTSAQDIATALEQRSPVSTFSIPARLRDASGRCYRLDAVATGIGRLADNDIVVDDPKVSRHHAVIIDTGSSYVINDLRSANGVEVRDQRIHGSAPLADGDVLRIGGHRFIFEITSGEAHG